MFSATDDITDELRQQVAAAIRLVQKRVRWKPGSAVAHLLKRRLRGHLPADATLADYDHLIAAYEVDVRFPDVSGMEHLDMLLTRSRIARVEVMLTPEQRRRVQAADRELTRQATRFYAAIRRIADLAAWRARENPSPAEWWWYLDVLAHLPPAVAQPMVRAEQPELAAVE